MDDTPTLDTIKRLRGLLAAAPPGPWTSDGELIWQVDQFGGDPMAGSIHPVNAELITVMRNELDGLLNAAEWLHGVLKRRDELVAEVRAAENAARDYRSLVETIAAAAVNLDERHAAVFIEYPPTD